MAETTKKPTFFWQATLVSLPVLVLLAMGLGSLRQDKILAHREAGERAQRLAAALLASSAATLTSPPAEAQKLRCPIFQVNSAGGLLFPPAIARLGPRLLIPDALTPEQARLWGIARKGEAQGKEPARVIEAYTAFVALQPPPNFTANALYSLGLLLATRSEPMAAADQFSRLIEGQPDSVAESGLPLQPLARLKLLELQPNLPSVERLNLLRSFCSNLVYRPTPLTPALLRDAARFVKDSASETVLQEWAQLWQQHERDRALAAAAHFTNHASTFLSSSGSNGIPASSNNMGPPAFWFSLEETFQTGNSADRVAQSWLAARYQETPEEHWFRCWTRLQAETELKAAVARVAPVMDYFGIELRVGGKSVVSPGADSGDGRKLDDPPARELLAFARNSENGVEWLEASVYLVRPALLYAQQQKRRLWFGSLIGVSAAAALMGLFASWRAFQRQQRLSEMKSNFVSSVSHELRTPVAAVQLLVEGLESGKISGPWKQQEYLRLIRQECRRLSALIDNILDFSRIEQGRKEFHFEPTDLAALIEHTVKIIEPYAAERKVSVATSIPPTASGSSRPNVVLDRSSIEQAVLNLVDNAIKHSPEGQTVTVGLDWPGNGASSAAAHDAPKNRVALWVEDRGGGIPPEEHEKIFERFYRRGSELRRETQGVGIGLSIVRHVVEGHGGRVLVRSAAGQGSRFTIELPLDSQPETPAHEH